MGDLRVAMGLAGEPDERTTIVFNGDFVDRGKDGAEVLACVCAMRLTFGSRVLVNRGNHEDVAVSSAYDFDGERAPGSPMSFTVLLRGDLSRVCKRCPDSRERCLTRRSPRERDSKSSSLVFEFSKKSGSFSPVTECTIAIPLT